MKLEGFFDADWGGSTIDRKSTSRCSFSLGSRVVFWYNRKQKLVAQSYAKVEYMATSIATCDAIWLCKLLARLFDYKLDSTVIYCDNQSCIILYENPMFHDKSKHVDIKYHFMRDCVKKGIVKIWYIPIEEQTKNILTKVLVKNKFVFFRDKLDVLQNTLLAKRDC